MSVDLDVRSKDELLVRTKEKKAPRKKLPHLHCTVRCTKPVNDEMIQCDGGCTPEWFHYECVDILASEIPEGDWLCPKCTKAETRKQKQSTSTEMEELTSKFAFLLREVEVLKRDRTRRERSSFESTVPLVETSRKSGSASKSGAESRFEKLLQGLSKAQDCEDDTDTEESQDEDMNKQRKKRGKKSGLYKKSSDKNKKPQEWPHLHLNMDVAGAEVRFRDLQVNTLVAGEIKIVSKCKEEVEKTSRLEFLKMIMYYVDTVEFDILLSWYGEWVRSIERGDHMWGNDPFKTEEMIMGRAKLGGGVKTRKVNRSLTTNSEVSNYGIV